MINISCCQILEFAHRRGINVSLIVGSKKQIIPMDKSPNGGYLFHCWLDFQNNVPQIIFIQYAITIMKIF